MSPIFHRSAKKVVGNFISNPSHGLIIFGQSGVGKGYVAKYIASKILNINIDNIESHPEILIISDKTKSISIEQIREIHKFIKLKTTGDKTFRRAIIVENIELMGIEAQNAFLKNLEEPPKDTLIILTSNNKTAVLQTIISRLQNINLLAPDKEQLLKLFQNNFAENKINKAYYLSEGNTGLMTALLNEDTKHPLVEQIEIAKDIYKKTIFERLNMVDNISKITNLNDLLFALELVCHAAMINSINNHDKSSKSWVKRSKIILESQDFMNRNPNSKLLLTDLFLNI